MTVTIKPGTPRRARYKPLKPLRRECRIPCALCFKRVRNFLAKLGRHAPRECEAMSRRHCERSEAIHSFLARHDGLLRFARNDMPYLILRSALLRASRRIAASPDVGILRDASRRDAPQ